MLHNLKMAIVFHSTNIFEHRLCVRVKEPRVKPRQGPHSGSSAIQILEEELASYDRQGKSNTLFYYIPWAKNDSYKVKSLKKIFLKRIFHENWEIHEVQILPIIKLDWNTVVPFCLHTVSGFFHSTKMSRCSTDHVAQKASNVWNLALYRKGLTDPWICFSQRPMRTDSYCCLGGFLFCFILPM